MRSDRVRMTDNCRTSLGLVVGVRNGQLDCILFGDSTEGFRDTTGGSGMHIWRSERSGLGLGVVRDCSGGSGLALDTTGVCLGLVRCHGYDRSVLCLSFPSIPCVFVVCYVLHSYLCQSPLLSGYCTSLLYSINTCMLRG